MNNYAGAIAIRFFLGVFEAAVTPGFALLTSQVRHLNSESYFHDTNLKLLSVVHQERTRKPSQHLVQLQRCRSNPGRAYRLRYRSRNFKAWIVDRAMEDYLPGYWSLDHCPRLHLPLDCPRQPIECPVAQQRGPSPGCGPSAG